MAKYNVSVASPEPAEIEKLTKQDNRIQYVPFGDYMYEAIDLSKYGIGNSYRNFFREKLVPLLSEDF